MSNQKCPPCGSDVQVDTTGVVEIHATWGQGGAYAMRCPGSLRNLSDLQALLAVLAAEQGAGDTRA